MKWAFGAIKEGSTHTSIGLHLHLNILIWCSVNFQGNPLHYNLCSVNLMFQLCHPSLIPVSKKKTVSSSISSDNLWNRTLSPPILVLWFWFRLFVLISHSGSPHHLLQSGFAPTWDDSLDLSLLQLRRNHRKYFQFLWTFLETIDVTAHPRLQSKCC